MEAAGDSEETFPEVEIFDKSETQPYLRAVWGGAETAQNRIRIVHISDTHLMHDKLLNEGLIPDGDILIHSGDFQQLPSTFCPRQETLEELQVINDFFGKLPHKHKIFIGGNHERVLEGHSISEIKEHLPNCVYLQDSSVTVCGLKIYGSPWTVRRWYSFAKAFTEKRDQMNRFWRKVPEDVDILVTHSPPLGVLDLETIPHGYKTLWKSRPWWCQHCHIYHDGNREHFGCDGLRRFIMGVRPIAHLFGHAHNPYGMEVKDGIIFSNAAAKVGLESHVIDIYTAMHLKE